MSKKNKKMLDKGAVMVVIGVILIYSSLHSGTTATSTSYGLLLGGGAIGLYGIYYALFKKSKKAE